MPSSSAARPWLIVTLRTRSRTRASRARSAISSGDPTRDASSSDMVSGTVIVAIHFHLPRHRRAMSITNGGYRTAHERRSAVAEAGVEGVAEVVAEEVDREDGEHDREAGEERDPPVVAH